MGQRKPKFWQIFRCCAMSLWNVSKYGVFSGSHFPAFGMNTGKNGPEKTPYLGTFHAVCKYEKDLLQGFN